MLFNRMIKKDCQPELVEGGASIVFDHAAAIKLPSVQLISHFHISALAH